MCAIFICTQFAHKDSDYFQINATGRKVKNKYIVDNMQYKCRKKLNIIA